MKRVLFVDDDANVLQGLRRMLRPMRETWHMRFAKGPDAAMQMLTAEPFDVVVTDMRMPNVDGAQLLEKVRAHDPGIARIVLSGQTDREAALRSSGAAHQFLAKPCQAEALKDCVQRVCRLRGLLNDDSVRALVTGIPSLPSLPRIYTALQAEMTSQNMALQRVAEIVATDVALTAKILQLVNSAFFGIPRPVENVAQAVTFLGADTIRSLALSTAVFSSFEDNCGSDLTSLWNHSLAVAAVAAAIAKEHSADRTIIGEALQAGMLHDVGQLVVAAFMPGCHEEIRSTFGADARPLHEVEHDVLGCGHAGIGAYLMGLWGLSDGIVEAIAYHHAPDAEPSAEFAPLTAVHAANTLVHAFEQPDDVALQARVKTGQLKVWADLAQRTLAPARAA